MKSDITKEQAEKIYNEFSGYIFRTALFLTKSKQLAEDITQETFLQVFRKYPLYHPSKPFKPWVYKITLNVARNAFRKQKWLEFFGDTPEVCDLELVEDRVLKSEFSKDVWEEIHKLSFKSREIIILHYYSGLKLDEIAIALGIPLGTAKSRLNAALCTLRKQLSKRNISIANQGGSIYGTIRP